MMISIETIRIAHDFLNEELAKRIPAILPPLSLNEALETTKIHSAARKIGKDASLTICRTFRSPHHTISDE
jgi:magnesium chelatase family protein